MNYLGKRVYVFSQDEATEMMKIQDLTISDGRNEVMGYIVFVINN